jgi:hypothetical protein
LPGNVALHTKSSASAAALLLVADPGAEPLLPGSQFGGELFAEVVRLEHGANLDLVSFFERRALDPLDRSSIDFTRQTQ